MDSSEYMDIIIIGAGLSGICALIKAQQEFPTITIRVFEKTNGIGGTWLKNSYPGLTCDIPSQLYSYSFAPKDDWSNIYATQAEILDYIQDTVSSYGCRDHIHLNQRCVEATWVEAECLWHVTLVDMVSNRRYMKLARFLITAVGFCDTPKDATEFGMLSRFQGHVFHSSNWDHTFDFEDKNVAVVGNGSSACQFIPYLLNQANVRNLVQIVRSPQWIAPKMNRPFSSWQRWLFQKVPILQKAFRLWLIFKLDLAYATFKTNLFGTVLRRRVQKSLHGYMEAAAPAKYRNVLIPNYEFGAKRPVLDDGYLSVLNSPKVDLVQSNSLTISGPSQVQIDSGQLFNVDVVILANGFKTQELLTPMEIHGNRDSELPKDWHKPTRYASAYMGTCVSDFPNLFLLTGPNTLPSGHSTLFGIECTVQYILRVISHLRVHSPLTGACRIDVKSDAQEAFNQWIHRRMEGLVYTAEVSNWYTDARSGKNTLIWPGSQFEFWWTRCVKAPSWHDFNIRAYGRVQAKND